MSFPGIRALDSALATIHSFVISLPGLRRRLLRILACGLALASFSAHAGTLQSFSIAPGSYAPGATTNYTFSFTTQTDVNPGFGHFILYAWFPSGFSVPGFSGCANVSITVNGSPAACGFGQSYSGIYVLVRPSALVPAGSNVTVTISNITNAGSAGVKTFTLIRTANGSGAALDDAPSLTVTLVTPNAAPTAGSVAITGGSSAKVGVALTGTYAYSDADGDAEGASTFRWMSDSASSGATKAAIAGATSINYTPVAGDRGRYLFFCVTPVALTGISPGAEACSGASSAVNIAPAAGSVAITGGSSAKVGVALTGTYAYSDADGDAQGASTFRWMSDSASSGATKAAIAGATSINYTPVAGDRGRYLFFCVTPVALTGASPGAEACSGASSAVNIAPTASSVAIAGVSQVGVSLTGTYAYSDADGDAQGASTLRWMSDSVSSGATKAAIAGATSTAYTPVAGDQGKYLFFCVTPVALTGASPGAEVCSGATAAVAPLPVTSFTGPSATGTGSVTASFTGGGVSCGYSVSQLIPVTAVAAPPPAGVAFPHGLFDFTTSGCTPGSTLSFTLTYPQALPAGTQYWKYGPTSGNAAPHWYVLPASIAGNTATFSITDGGLGDDDLAANGTIVDQGGPGAGLADIPTLSGWAMIFMGLLLAGLGAARIRTRET